MIVVGHLQDALVVAKGCLFTVLLSDSNLLYRGIVFFSCFGECVQVVFLWVCVYFLFALCEIVTRFLFALLLLIKVQPVS